MTEDQDLMSKISQLAGKRLLKIACYLCPLAHLACYLFLKARSTGTRTTKDRVNLRQLHTLYDMKPLAGPRTGDDIARREVVEARLIVTELWF